MKTIVILNPNAGNDEMSFSDLKKMLPWEIKITEHAGHATQIAQELGKQGPCHIVVGGGDGTIHEAINGLMSLNKDQRDHVVLGALPLGTANDLCRSLGMDEDLSAAIQMQLSPQVYPLDVMKIQLDGDSSRYSINLCSTGFVPRMAQRITKDQKEFWGPAVYARVSAETALDWISYKVTITIDDKDVIHAKVWNIVAANGSYGGGGIPIATESQLDSGFVDLHVFEDKGILPSLTDGFLSFFGNHMDSDGVKIYRCKKAAILSSPPISVSADGEYLGEGSPTITVIPNALHCVVGPKAKISNRT